MSGKFESVWAETKFGAACERSKEIRVKSSYDKSASSIFKFNAKNGILKELTATYPVDRLQVPDIFVNVFQSSLLKTTRIGFLRIQATS